MDDLTPFDRQIAAEFIRDAGPSQPVDDLAIYDSIVTATQYPKWRFQSMFNATKFVVAGAIVALFGGFLLAGVLTQPSEEMTPAVGASASAPPESPASQETMSLTWERVEVPAGVDMDDGYRTHPRNSTGTYLIASSPARTVVSRDGLTWSEVPVEGKLIDAWGGSLVVADGVRLATVLVTGDEGSTEDRPLWIDSLALPAGVSLERQHLAAYGPAGLLLVTSGLEGIGQTAWHTADGQSWEQVYELAGEAEGIMATADGFVATTDRGGDFTVMHSSDGLSWNRLDEPMAPSGRYRLVGAGPFGAVLAAPGDSSRGTGAPVLAAPDRLEPLTVPAEVEARWTSSDPDSWPPDSWGAGGLGVVGLGIADRMVALSTDGVTWHLGTLPDTVPRLLEGWNGLGRPILHVAEDVVFLETYVCLEPDGTEVDCQQTGHEGDKQVWFRGTPVAAAE